MSRRRRQQFWLAAVHSLLVCVLAAPHIQGQAKPASPANPSQAEKMTNQTRLQVIRSLQSERVFARVLFPQGDKGLKIKNGVVSPTDIAIAQQVAEFGPAAKPGDRCVITNVDIKEKEIIFEINGGPKKKGKWYQHIQVSGNGGASAPLPGTPSPQSLDAHGSVVTLEFDKYVPEMSGDQVRAMLAPVFDFKALTPVEAYQKTLSPKLQEAIKDHKILVGMDKEMVMYAKGRPQQRIRDKDDHGQDYEEWIYGKPPEEVNFVRFKGNEVARLEIMTVDGNKIVRTEREVDLPATNTEVAEQKPAQKQQQKAPTLRRPGEEVEYPTQGTTTSQRTPRPQDGQPNSGNSPYPNGGNSPYPNSGGSTNPNATGGPVPPPSTTTPPINPNDAPHVAPSN
jgi:hypothetical protein